MLNVMERRHVFRTSREGKWKYHIVRGACKHISLLYSFLVFSIFRVVGRRFDSYQCHFFFWIFFEFFVLGFT